MVHQKNLNKSLIKNYMEKCKTTRENCYPNLNCKHSIAKKLNIIFEGDLCLQTE